MNEWESLDTHAERLLPADFPSRVLEAVRRDRHSAAMRKMLLVTGAAVALLSNGILLGVWSLHRSVQPPQQVSAEKYELLKSL